MSYESKPGQGAMFHNDKRTEANNQPHYRGTLKLLNGQDIEISAWIKHDKKGNKFLSLSQGKPYVREVETAPEKEDLPF